MQCNYIISNEFEKEKDSNNRKCYKNFNYPNIQEPCNNETCINFIKNIDDILLKNFDLIEFTDNNLLLFDLQGDLVNKMDEISILKNLMSIKYNNICHFLV